MEVRLDDALAGRAPFALAGLGDALLAQDRVGLVEVAIGLLERLLAVHHARAGHLAELLDQLHRNLRH